VAGIWPERRAQDVIADTAGGLADRVQ